MVKTNGSIPSMSPYPEDTIDLHEERRISQEQQQELATLAAQNQQNRKGTQPLDLSQGSLFYVETPSSPALQQISVFESLPGDVSASDHIDAILAPEAEQEVEDHVGQEPAAVSLDSLVYDIENGVYDSLASLNDSQRRSIVSELAVIRAQGGSLTPAQIELLHIFEEGDVSSHLVNSVYFAHDPNFQTLQNLDRQIDAEYVPSTPDEAPAPSDTQTMRFTVQAPEDRDQSTLRVSEVNDQYVEWSAENWATYKEFSDRYEQGRLSFQPSPQGSETVYYNCQGYLQWLRAKKEQMPTLWSEQEAERLVWLETLEAHAWNPLDAMQAVINMSNPEIVVTFARDNEECTKFADVPAVAFGEAIRSSNDRSLPHIVESFDDEIIVKDLGVFSRSLENLDAVSQDPTIVFAHASQLAQAVDRVEHAVSALEVKFASNNGNTIEISYVDTEELSSIKKATQCILDGGDQVNSDFIVNLYVKIYSFIKMLKNVRDGMLLSVGLNPAHQDLGAIFTMLEQWDSVAEQNGNSLRDEINLRIGELNEDFTDALKVMAVTEGVKRALVWLLAIAAVAAYGLYVKWSDNADHKPNADSPRETKPGISDSRERVADAGSSQVPDKAFPINSNDIQKDCTDLTSCVPDWFDDADYSELWFIYVQERAPFEQRIHGVYEKDNPVYQKRLLEELNKDPDRMATFNVVRERKIRAQESKK